MNEDLLLSLNLLLFVVLGTVSLIKKEGGRFVFRTKYFCNFNGNAEVWEDREEKKKKGEEKKKKRSRKKMIEI